MSKNAHDALEAFPEYVTESRGDIFIKVNITRYIGNQFLPRFLFYTLKLFISHVLLICVE